MIKRVEPKDCKDLPQSLLTTAHSMHWQIFEFILLSRYPCLRTGSIGQIQSRLG